MKIEKLYVAEFNPIMDDYEQSSIPMSLGECRKYIKGLREKNPSEKYAIIAVLDE